MVYKKAKSVKQILAPIGPSSYGPPKALVIVSTSPKVVLSSTTNQVVYVIALINGSFPPW